MSVGWVPRIGAEFVGYRLDSLIGHGGMSIVYRAEHLSLGRTVALKLLAPELSEDQDFRERFLRESRMAAGLDHPNIIPIYEAGEESGCFYIAMRYVEGSDLKTVLKDEGPLDPVRAVTIIGQVASALAAAHAKGLVHRDVKPANILIASGHGPEESDHVYLSDFGVVKHSASQALTRTGVFVGTAEYAAPEQIEGKTLDGRADIYALGCVAYECLAAMPVYDKDSEVALMYAHLLEPPPPLTQSRPELPTDVDDALAKAMAKSPEERYQTPREFAAGFRQALLGETQVPGVTGAVQQTVLARSPGGEEPAGAPPEPATTASPDGGGAAAPVPTPVAPAPPAGPQAGPGGPGGPGGRRNLLLLGALLAALLIGGGIAAALALTGGDDDGSANTGTGTDTTTTQVGEPGTLLSVLVPTEVANACTKEATPRPSAVETLTCVPFEGARSSFPNNLELSFFTNQQKLDAAYESEKEGVELGRCGSTTGERVWIHEETQGRGGRRFCYVNDDDEAVVVWSHEKLDAEDHVDMLGIAREGGRSPTLFRSWWNAAKNVIGKCRSGGVEEVCLDTITSVTA